jgi:hypothetical protein
MQVLKDFFPIMTVCTSVKPGSTVGAGNRFFMCFQSLAHVLLRELGQDGRRERGKVGKWGGEDAGSLQMPVRGMEDGFRSSGGLRQEDIKGREWI